MIFLSHGRQALINLSAAKLRSFLAVLGVLVGTAAVVALMSCGQLATEKALAQFKALGTDLLAIAVFQKEAPSAQQNNASIALDKWRQIPKRIPYIREIAPYATAYQPISFLGHVLQGPIIGADESLANIVKIKMQQGHFVSFVDTFEHFCVIGSRLAEQIKHYNADPMGKQIRIGKILYTIIGIAAPWQENGFFNEDINQAVIVPVAGISLISKDSAINNAIMLLKTDSPIDLVIDNIKQFIAKEAPKLTTFPRSAKQIITSMESQGRIFTLLLAVIGGISLLVGGIGIMNVMLVSVSERKKEIGIRKAVGAKNSEIQGLFLMESVLLSLVGGGLGVLLGLLFTWIMAYFSDWPFIIYWTPPLAGFLVSIASGIFFGFYPAHRASKMAPIISLRSE